MMVAQERTAEAPPSDEEAGGVGSLGSIIHLLLLAWGVFLGALPLNDNSFFTHLATGRLILDSGSVPSVDPYTFTAQGEPWTVQSWLASVSYATAEQLGGGTGVRLLIVVVFAVATTIVWALTKPARSLIPRAVLASVAMVVCSGVWSERPYMIGFIGLGLLWLALEGRISHWTLVPLMWVWANTHGSYPLALLLVGATVAGSALDGRRDGGPVELRQQLLVLRSVLLGLAASVVSPLGVRTLTFPIEGLARSDTLRMIVEWQAPEFTSVAERAFLLLGIAAVASLVVRPQWRVALPVLVFFSAALVARRNVVMALPVLLPVIAAAVPELGTLRAATRPALGRLVAGTSAVLVAVVLLVGLGRPSLGLGGYPTRPLAFQADARIDGRLIVQDFTGNFLEVLDGPVGEVFIDDRADMFPADIIEDYRILNTTEPAWEQVLDRRAGDVVVWSRSHPLGSVIASDPRWRIQFSDTKWFLAVRR